ncbi:MAG: hypothetical protein JWM88_2553, partial [Verrucomicrobia bacterium]|nr:hypothetical protein [Verrucomicrobiota bacterium]
MKKLLLLSLAFAFGPSLFAVNPEPYTLGVSFSFRIYGTGNGIMSVYDATGATPTVAVTASASLVESPISTAWLCPSQDYELNIQTSGTTAYWLSFIAPEGYQTYVDGAPTSVVSDSTGSAGFSRNYHIVLRPVVAGGRRDAGIFSGINLGKAVGWEIGLGGNRSGHSMGLVGFRERDLTNSPASRDRLIYAPPINNFQCTVVKNGPSSQTISQIHVAQCVLDFVDIAGGYRIDFYDPAAAPWDLPTQRYAPSGAAWKQIFVETPGANQLKITETENGVSRISSLSLTSGSVSTGNYVWTLQEGNSSAWARTTTHTSTMNGDGTRDDVVVTRTGGTSGTIAAKSKYRYSNPGGLNTSQANTINYNTTNLPLTATPGASISFTCNVTNSGTNTWGSNHYLVLRDYVYANLSFASLSGLVPGTNTNASLSMTAPTSPGTYTYYLQGLENTVMWFASSATVTLTVVNSGGTGTTDTANYNTTTFPLSVMPGVTLNFSTNLTNTGTNAWGSNHYLVLRDAGWSNIFFASLNGVAAGTSTNASLTLDGLGNGGTYVYHLQGENNGVTWFSSSISLSIIVNSTSWGEELVQVIDDPDTAALTKTFTYYADRNYPGNYRRVKSVTESTGNWTAFSYYDDWDRRGQVQYEYHPYLDSPATAASAATTTGRAVYYEYAPDWTGRYVRPSLRQERINNVVTAKSILTYVSPSTEQADIDSYRDASNYQRDRVERIR